MGWQTVMLGVVLLVLTHFVGFGFLVIARGGSSYKLTILVQHI
jgi:hypothetical protein